LKPLYPLVCVCIYFSSCNAPKEEILWGNATIDSAIRKEPVYAQLDKQAERFSFLEHHDSSMKRTSDVKYVIGREMNPGEYRNPQPNNCRAWLPHADTLVIDIGMGTGFGGRGFIIKYSGRKFYTQPYFATDAIILDEPEPIYKIVFQNLTLDKSGYKLGDSLHGKIDFKSIEMKRDGTTIEHAGNGYFRTEIGKR
jgi:hypothetical protein